MTDAERELLRCDILLLVATSSEEKALKLEARERGIAFQAERVGSLEFFCMGTIGATKVNAVRTDMGPFSYEGSASKAIHYRVAMGATGIIQVGMCFGVDESWQTLGDVVVSKYLIAYDRRDVTTVDGKYKVDYSLAPVHEAKPSLIQMIQRRLEQWNEPYKVFIGGVLSGGARIWSTPYLKEVVEGVPKVEGGMIVGGEMEAVGLLSISPPDNPLWMVVKGICDFADENRHRTIDEARPRACRNAASLVLSALAQPIDPGEENQE